MDTKKFEEIPVDILQWVDSVVGRNSPANQLVAGAPTQRWTHIVPLSDKRYGLIRSVGTWPDGEIYWHWTLHDEEPNSLAILSAAETSVRYAVISEIQARNTRMVRKVTIVNAPTPENYGTW